MLDMMAHRYGCLPSQLYANGNSLDIWVFETSMAYQDYQRKMEQARNGKGPIPAPDIPVNTLQEMMDKVKGKQVGSQTKTK